MNPMLRAFPVVALATVCFSSASYGFGNENARILLHLTSTTVKNPCAALMPNCMEIVTHGDLHPAAYFAYVLVTDADSAEGVAGVEWGIDYGAGDLPTDGAGIDIWQWHFCGTAEFPQPSPVWPASGGGNMVTWDINGACQRYVPAGVADPAKGVVASAGYFYITAYSVKAIGITVRPLSGYAKVENCAGQEDTIAGPGVNFVPSHLGYAGFGPGNPGYSPCGMTPVENTTWSRLKSLHSQ